LRPLGAGPDRPGPEGRRDRSERRERDVGADRPARDRPGPDRDALQPQARRLRVQAGARLRVQPPGRVPVGPRLGTVSAAASAPGPRSSATRVRVLEAAVAAICERGLSGTRVADIAGRAGMSPGNVMYHFGTLEEMLVEALR